MLILHLLFKKKNVLLPVYTVILLKAKTARQKIKLLSRLFFIILIRVIRRIRVPLFFLPQCLRHFHQLVDDVDVLRALGLALAALLAIFGLETLDLTGPRSPGALGAQAVVGLPGLLFQAPHAEPVHIAEVFGNVHIVGARHAV